MTLAMGVCGEGLDLPFGSQESVWIKSIWFRELVGVQMHCPMMIYSFMLAHSFPVTDRMRYQRLGIIMLPMKMWY